MKIYIESSVEKAIEDIFKSHSQSKEMNRIYKIQNALKNGVSLEQALQLAGRLGVAAHVEGDMLVLDGIIMTAPEGGDPEITVASSIEEALDLAFEKEAGYLADDDLPSVVAIKAFYPAFDIEGTEHEVGTKWRIDLLQEPEPPCSEPEHEWLSPVEVVGGSPENPGVWANSAGGVSITEVCPHCGLAKYTDTLWSDPSTGTLWEGVVRYDSQSYREAALQWAASILSK